MAFRGAPGRTVAATRQITTGAHGMIAPDLGRAWWRQAGVAMPLVYVTGISGAGKSTVCRELRRRGVDPHDTDEDGNAVWVDVATGATTSACGSDDPEWLATHEWRLVPDRVAALARQATDRLVFLCGSAANEAVVWPHFTTVIYLAVDERTLRHRLATRTTNDFGKAPHELAAILGWHRVDAYRRFGAVVVDATQPLPDVVDEVIAITTSEHRRPAKESS
jgi:broad-specificity NMP kinase